MSGNLGNKEHKLISDHLQNMKITCEDSFEELRKNWTSIYGPEDPEFGEKLRKLQDELKQFWEDQIGAVVSFKNQLMAKVEVLGKEAFNLEKALSLPSNSSSTSLSVAPLLKLEDELKKLVNSYNEIRNERYREYLELKEQENELCEILNEKAQLADLARSSGLNEAEEAKSPRLYVPTSEDLAAAIARIQVLKGLQNELETEFAKLKGELKTILDDCEIRPFNKVECAAFGHGVVFPCTKMNFETLLEVTEGYRLTRAELASKADGLRIEISSLWHKMLKDDEELQVFLSLNKDFKKSTIDQLETKLKALRLERKEKMKELILASRIALDELWTKCCYSDDQRAQFKPYYANHYTEDVLDFHELEVDRLRFFYDENRQIYQLAARHEELWQRLLTLEEQAKRSDRLFKNRGGQLLQEEKERKLVQKKLPAIKRELMSLLEQHKNTHGSDFLYFGEPLIELLEHKEEERQASKENEKLQRKVANEEALQLECRLGARSAHPVAGCKRKMMTPQPSNMNREETAILRKRMQSPTPQRCPVVTPRTPARKTPAHRTPAPKTPAASDLNNGSPTYESFQEHMNTISNEDCLSSTKELGRTVLRLRNLRNKAETPRLTPYKAPSKTPTRIATGSKILSVVPPISPRSGSKLTASRVKLPIIF